MLAMSKAALSVIAQLRNISSSKILLVCKTWMICVTSSPKTIHAFPTKYSHYIIIQVSKINIAGLNQHMYSLFYKNMQSLQIDTSLLE